MKYKCALLCTECEKDKCSKHWTNCSDLVKEEATPSCDPYFEYTRSYKIAHSMCARPQLMYRH